MNRRVSSRSSCHYTRLHFPFLYRITQQQSHHHPSPDIHLIDLELCHYAKPGVLPTIAGTFYFYIVAAWGGYVFITKTIPLRAFVLIIKACFPLAWIPRLLQLV